MITHLEGYILVKEFADLCGILPKTVYERVLCGRVSGLRIDGKLYVYKKHSVIAPRVSKKVIATFNAQLKQQAPAHASPVGIITANLIRVKIYAKHLKIRTNAIYERIINNKMDAVVIAGDVFIDKVKYPISGYDFGRKLSRNRRR